MRSISIQLPESLLASLNVSGDLFATEARMAIAVKLFEMGKFTSGQAAELAQIPRSQFLLSLPQYVTPSVTWDREEIDAESRASFSE